MENPNKDKNSPIAHLQIPIICGEKIYVEDCGKLRAAKILSYDKDKNTIYAEEQLPGNVFVPININLDKWSNYLAFRINEKEEM